MVENDLIQAFENQETPRTVQVNLDETPAVETPTEPIVEAAKVETPAEPAKVIETPTEPKVETPTPVVEKKEVKEPSFFEKLSGKTETPANEPPKATELPDDVKAKLEEYDKLVNNDIFKLFNGDKDLSKVDLKELGKQLLGENLEALSNEDLVNRAVKEKYPDMDADDFEAMVERNLLKLESLEDKDFDKEKNKLIADISKNQSQSDIFKTLADLQKKQSVDPQKEFQQQIETARTNIENRYKELAEKVVGQEYNGYTATKEDADGILNAFTENVNNFKPESNFLQIFKAVTYDKAVQAAETRGYERAMTLKANPDAGSTQPIIAPITGESGLKNMTTADFFEMGN